MGFDAARPGLLIGRRVEAGIGNITASAFATEDEYESATASLLQRGAQFVIWPSVSGAVCEKG